MSTKHTKTPDSDPIVEALFGEGRRAVLETLFSGKEPLHVREIIRRCDVGAGAVQREIGQLLEAGLLLREEQGNRVYYRADEDSPCYEEIRALVIKMRSIGDTEATVARLPELSRGTVERYGLLPDGVPVLAMVSGGADSVSLLRLLAGCELGERPIRVLHVDHRLRPDSASDASWVEGLCGELGVPCTVVREDVSRFAEEDGLNLEDAGRIVRYRLADEEADALAVEAGCDPRDVRIATAHTRDDLVETILMRLAQGAGHGALAGIRPARGRIVRPLLDATRRDVLAYLADLAQEWREDATNTDTSRLRARIRHELVPVFESINPGYADALARSAALLADDDSILQEMADAFAADFATDEGEDLAFDLMLMRTLSKPMARRVLRTAVALRFPEASRIEAAHIEAVADGLWAESFARDVTGGLRVWVECGRMFVSRHGGSQTPFDQVELAVPGVAQMGRAGRIEAALTESRQPSEGPREAWLDADSIGTGLTVGPPREGERIRPLGMRGTKKVSDLLIDEKVPARIRRLVPVVRTGETVVWVAGVRVCEDHKVTSQTERVLHLRWIEE